MNYYKGTQQQCEEYLSLVNSSENYQGTTTTWSDIIEREGNFYILKHEKYSSDLELSDLPNIPENEDI